jgi:hypothetical protein
VELLWELKEGQGQDMLRRVRLVLDREALGEVCGVPYPLEFSLLVLESYGYSIFFGQAFSF